MQRVDSVILECPHCQAKNRVLAARLNEAPTCGSCRHELLSGAPLRLDDESFAAVIAASARPVAVDFWAGWCGPCKRFAPVFADAAARNSRVLFAKVDTDANPHTSSHYAIRSIPTLVVFRDGRIADRLSGALPAGQFEAWLRSALA